MELLGTVWFCLLAALGFGFVIFIHELGHFLFAKWAGVRVDRFSIGFGPVILRKQIGETEYALSLLPLGGYVKMLGQEDTPAEITGEAKTDPRSYLAKSYWWQTAILLGGVLFNLISSYFILLGIAWYGKQTIVPVVGSVVATIKDEQGHNQPSPAARMGLKAGDRILTVNGQPMREFDTIQMAIISSGKDPLVMTVQRLDAAGVAQEIRLPADGPGISAAPDYDNGRLTFGIKQMEGMTVAFTKAYAAKPFPDAPKSGERIIAIAGKPLPANATGQTLRDLLQPYAGTTVALTLRADGERTVTLPYGGEVLDGSLATGFPVRIDSMIPGGDPAGLRPGDVIISVDSQPIAGVLRFLGATRVGLNENRAFPVRVWRDGQEMDLTVRGRDLSGRQLVGASPDIVTGFLPVLPVAFDGKPSPLSEAGIVPGDAIIDLSEPTDDVLKPREAAVVSGGQRILIPLSTDDGIASRRGDPPGRLTRLFGATGTPSLASELRGKRVTAVEGPVLQLATRDGVALSRPSRGLTEAGWSALTAGLKPGDWITGVVPTADAFAFEVVRGAGAPRSVTIKPRDPGVAMVLDPVAMTTYELKAWTEAFSIANDAAYSMVVKTLQIIPKFFKSTKDGGLDPNKALTGPIGIFTMLKGSAERYGLVKYLELMALIGLNLFLINLLPIPVTDGGQLMFLTIEAVTRRPLASWARNIAMYIGLAMVMALMLYVIGLDILREIG
jgi:membrane-associated protease RseP (regulator of RpoE activity)